jgi:hypothetical protein
MKDLSPAVTLALAVSLIAFPGAAWAWGTRAGVVGPSSPVNVIVVRPSPVVVTPPEVKPLFVDRPIIDHHRFVRPIVPKPPSLKPLPQPVWVPGSWQRVDAQWIWVPSHFEGPGQILILQNPRE